MSKKKNKKKTHTHKGENQNQVHEVKTFETILIFLTISILQQNNSKVWQNMGS